MCLEWLLLCGVLIGWLLAVQCSTVLNRTVQCIIQFLKVMYSILTLQVLLTLPSVFPKTDSVFLKEDTQKCVFNNTSPRACISQYNPMGVYWLVQALGQVLCNTHSWASAQRMYRTLGLGSFSHSQTSPGESFCQDAFGYGQWDAVPYCHPSELDQVNFSSLYELIRWTLCKF